MHFPKLFIILLVMLLALRASAQRPDYTKMSPLVREACILSQNRQTSNNASRVAPLKKPTITAFLKTALSTEELNEAGCKVLAKYGNLYVVNMPLTQIATLSTDKKVQRIEAGRSPRTTMDTTNIIIGSSLLHEGINLPKAFTGSGVVVGVQDIGFDLTHPTFYSRDMKRYRIKAMWDQLSTDSIGSRMAIGRDYRDSVSLLTLGHPRDGMIQTHGTHTTGIAAGSGSEGEPLTSYTDGKPVYSGVAPDADICLVCNATSDDAELISPDDYYKYTYALDALGFKYIFDYADSVGKPCVINFSEGSQEDFWGNDLLYYEMLDSLIGPGHIIVASAGNEGGKSNYVHKPNDIEALEINATSQWHGKTLSFTTRATGDFSLRLLMGDETIKEYKLDDVISAADSTLNDSLIADGKKYKLAAVAYNDCYDKTCLDADWVITCESYIYPSSFQIQCIGNNSDIELYPGSAVLSSSTASGNNASITIDNSHSILSPGSAPNVICVGMTGYRTSLYNYLGNLMLYGGSRDGKINQYSSVGPTFDGRIKPDVVAPGQNIVSSYSSFYIENNPNASDINSDVRHFQYNGRTYAWNSNMGTSMSAPVVAGTIALWLQANPRLTPQECISIFKQTCTHYDNGMTYPNNIYGYGQIDAEAGLRLILENTTGIKTVNSDKKDKKIYTIDGCYLGTDAQRLSKGIYIIGGKKILIK